MNNKKSNDNETERNVLKQVDENSDKNIWKFTWETNLQKSDCYQIYKKYWKSTTRAHFNGYCFRWKLMVETALKIITTIEIQGFLINENTF